MKNSKVLKAFLIISGLLLTFIGAAQLIIPVEMKADSGIDIAGNVGVINDVRASNMLLLAVGLLTVIGAFTKKLTYAASLTSLIVFLSLGLGRVVSILVDGMPVDGLINATGLELILGITGTILFAVYREKRQTNRNSNLAMSKN